jgi:putative DNA primase/helicase
MREHAADKGCLPTLHVEGAGSGDSRWFRRLAEHAFRTPEGTAFIEIGVAGRWETVPIQGKSFRQWLLLKLHEESGKPPSQATLTSFVNSLEAYASQNAPEAEVHVRVAFVGGRIYFDLADDLGRAVEIDPEGWKVIDKAPVHFIRPPSMRPLPAPEQGGSIQELRSVINAADDDFVLIVAWLLDALRHDRGHPLLIVNGAEGTAKSTLVEILRALIDPTSMPAGGLPQSERELHKAGQPYLRVFDNVSAMSATISDAICRLSIGMEPTQDAGAVQEIVDQRIDRDHAAADLNPAPSRVRRAEKKLRQRHREHLV